MERWRVIPFGYFDSFENMATDEAILRAYRHEGMPPTLRLYGWKKPAVSLGYFQDIDDEIHYEYCLENGIDIVRRPTGGRAVLHGDDLTYSLVAEENNRHFSSDIIKTYSTISKCIIRGLERSGVHAEMVEEGRALNGSAGSFCFASSYKNELLADGKKICGSAQVRAKGMFLQHGSILMDFDPVAVCAAIITKTADPAALETCVTSIRGTLGYTVEMTDLCRNIKAGFEDVLGIRLIGGELSPEEKALRDDFLRNKYGNTLCNTGRGVKIEH